MLYCEMVCASLVCCGSFGVEEMKASLFSVLTSLRDNEMSRYLYYHIIHIHVAT